MLRSMTAFARTDLRQEWGSLTWEIRSVNHRYLEPQFRLPESLKELEPELRELLRNSIKRGKLECSLKFQPEAQAASGALHLNLELAQDMNRVLNQINRLLDNPAHINAFDILQWPGVLQVEETDLEPVKEEALRLFEEALDRLIEIREREGQHLRPLIEDRLDQIVKIVAQVRDLLPEILQRQREAILARFEELQIELDPNRLEQEMVLLAQKADVAEELDRLDAHVKEVRATLNSRDAVGRRLDFLMQELNREANTLSSKSIVTETTRSAVDLKVLIEQMREQIQNIE